MWNLYQLVWFDEVIHAFSIFAVTLALALAVRPVALAGADRRRIVLVLTVASIGLAVGALWEIGEWAYDQLFVADLIKGKQDTIVDLIADAVGATAAGVAALRIAAPSAAGGST